MKNKSILLFGTIVGLFICLVHFDLDSNAFSEQKSKVKFRQEKPRPTPTNGIPAKRNVQHFVQFI